MAMLLIIEDEAVLARNVARFFEKLGHTVEVAHDGPAGVEAARRVMPDVAIVDFQLPGLDGLEVIGALRKIDAELRCVMVTGHASVPVAIDAMKAGYMDLLTKPVALASLKAVVDRALAERGTRRALDYYQKKEADESSLEALAGDSAPMQALRDLVRTMALSEPADGSPGAPVLVLGETGAGKELVARACHYAGPRASAPFVEINCAALPAHLIEGELFGHEKGAFTDAQARKIGLIEAADGGTLFLDEIGELDLSLQAKLLRVLENFRVRRLGALQDRLVNVRVVCATNRDLDQLVEAGRFRADLLYRLRVFQINIPPLRARGDDVLLLLNQILAVMTRRLGRQVLFAPEALSALRAYAWPGNVRELESVLERMLHLSEKSVLTLADLPQPIGQALPSAAPATPADRLYDRHAAAEREAIVRAGRETAGHLGHVAERLGISRATLWRKMKQYGLTKEHFWQAGPTH